MKISLTIKQLIKTGIHIGHQKNRWNIKMSHNILGIIKDTHILNLEETIIMLRITLNILKEIILNRKNILIVNNLKNNNNIQIIKNKYIDVITNDDWVNGYLTNKLYIIQKKRIPELIIIYDINNNLYTIKEANQLNIPIIAIADSNTDISHITYPIPGNNDSIESIELISNLINNVLMDNILNEKILFKKNYLFYKLK